MPAAKLCASFHLCPAACSKHLDSRTQTVLREKVFSVLAKTIGSLPARISWSLLNSFCQSEWIVWIVGSAGTAPNLSVSIPGGAYDGSRKRPQSFEYEVYEIRHQTCDSSGARPSTKTKQRQKDHHYHFPRRLSGSDSRRKTLKNTFVGDVDFTSDEEQASPFRGLRPSRERHNCFRIATPVSRAGFAFVEWCSLKSTRS